MPESAAAGLVDQWLPRPSNVFAHVHLVPQVDEQCTVESDLTAFVEDPGVAPLQEAFKELEESGL